MRSESKSLEALRQLRGRRRLGQLRGGEHGSLVALLGPSGSSRKDAVLRILAGLESADSGRVSFDDEEATHVRARSRGIGFVFQHYALFRHLTVGDDVAFGLDVRKVPKEISAKRAKRALAAGWASAGLEHRYPAPALRGRRRRVALARALAPEPSSCCWTKPFGAVDAKVRGAAPVAADACTTRWASPPSS